MINTIDINRIDLEKSKLKTSIKVDRENVRSTIKLAIVDTDGDTQTLRIRNITGAHGIISICNHCVDCDKTHQIEFKCDEITDMISKYFSNLVTAKGDSIMETVKLANLILNKLNK